MKSDRGVIYNLEAQWFHYNAIHVIIFLHLLLGIKWSLPYRSWNKNVTKT